MKMWQVFIMIGSLNIFYSASKAETVVNGSFLIKLFESKSKEVSTIKATINRPIEGNLQARTVDLNWDMNSDLINARAVVDVGKDKPATHILVRNSKVEWRGVDLYNAVVGNAYSLVLSNSRESAVPQQIEDNDYSLKWIKRLFIPYHLLEMQKIPPEMLGKLDIKTEVSPNKNGHLIFRLLGYVGGRLGGEVIYDIDISDGLKIYSMQKIDIKSDGNVYVSKKQDFANHKKINGTWVPFEMTEKWFNDQEQEIQSVVLEMLKCEINPEFTEDDFSFIPPEGSFVEDRISGITYNVGYSEINDLGEIYYEGDSASRKSSVTKITETSSNDIVQIGITSATAGSNDSSNQIKPSISDPNDCNVQINVEELLIRKNKSNHPPHLSIPYLLISIAISFLAIFIYIFKKIIK